MEIPKESKKKVTLAVVASILFHILLLLLFAFWMELRGSETPIPPPEPEKPLEITFIPESPEMAVAAAPTPRENIRTDNFTAAATPPPDAKFDSDRDTVAGGNQPGAGSRDLPNVEGRKSNDLALQDQEVTLGGTSSASGPATPKKEPEKPTPQPTPPTEVAKIDLKPQPTPAPPEPLSDNEIAVGRATPTPEPTAPPRPIEPSTGGGQAYQPQMRATRIEGSLSNRGRPSFATRGTPLGRYLRQVENAIGSRWYFYIKRDADLVSPGAVRILFTIDRSGKVGNLRVLSNTSNESFASTSTQSIMEAEFPPIPDDVASTLYTQRLELPFTFTIY